LSGCSPAGYIAFELHRLGACDELIERLAPSLAESHSVVRVAATLVQECIALPPEMVCSTAKMLLGLKQVIAANTGC
jgi:hypothetical protein